MGKDWKGIFTMFLIFLIIGVTGFCIITYLMRQRESVSKTEFIQLNPTEIIEYDAVDEGIDSFNDIVEKVKEGLSGK